MSFRIKKVNIKEYNSSYENDFIDNYNHIYNGIELLKDLTIDNQNTIKNSNYNIFKQNYFNIIEFNNIHNLELDTMQFNEIQIVNIYNLIYSLKSSYNLYLKEYINNLINFDILEKYNINELDLLNYIKENFEIDTQIKAIKRFLNDYCYLYNIDLTNKFEFDNEFLQWRIKHNTTKNNTQINEPQNNSNADTNTGEYKLTQKDRELLLSKKTKKNMLNFIFNDIIKQFEYKTQRINYFIEVCNKENIDRFTFKNLNNTKPKYEKTNTKIENDNKELITLIQNIFKNAF